MTAALAPDETGEFTTWRATDTGSFRPIPDGRPKLVMHVTDLDYFRRDPQRPDIILYDDERYLIGQEHPARPFHQYVYRLHASDLTQPGTP